MKKFTLGILVLILVLYVSGCATFFTKTPTENDVMLSQQAVADASIIVAIEQPTWVPEMIRVSTSAIEGLNSGKITTLVQIKNLMLDEARSAHYSEKTIQYVNLFMTNILIIIQQKGQVSLDVPVQICMVAQWVNNSIGGSAVCGNQLVTAPAVAK
jgi:hypothetical protein